MAFVALLGASLGIEIAQAQTPPLCVPQKPSASATASATRCVDAEARAAARQAAQEQAIAKLSCPTLSEVQRRNLCRRAGLAPDTASFLQTLTPPIKHFAAVPTSSGQCIALRQIALSSASTSPPPTCIAPPTPIRAVATVAATCGVICSRPR
jgi:hypothetical protein